MTPARKEEVRRSSHFVRGQLVLVCYCIQNSVEPQLRAVVDAVDVRRLGSRAVAGQVERHRGDRPRYVGAPHQWRSNHLPAIGRRGVSIAAARGGAGPACVGCGSCVARPKPTSMGSGCFAGPSVNCCARHVCYSRMCAAAPVPARPLVGSAVAELCQLAAAACGSRRIWSASRHPRKERRAWFVLYALRSAEGAAWRGARDARGGDQSMGNKGEGV